MTVMGSIGLAPSLRNCVVKKRNLLIQKWCRFLFIYYGTCKTRIHMAMAGKNAGLVELSRASRFSRSLVRLASRQFELVSSPAFCPVQVAYQRRSATSTLDGQLTAIHRKLSRTTKHQLELVVYHNFYVLDFDSAACD